MNNVYGLDGVDPFNVGYLALDAFFAAGVGGGVMLFGGSRKAALITAGSLIALGVALRAAQPDRPAMPPAPQTPLIGSDPRTWSPTPTIATKPLSLQTSQPLNDLEMLDQMAGWGV